MNHTIEFIPSGRGRAQNLPNPSYPDGITVTVNENATMKCSVDLPYPAPECGIFIVECELCHLRVAITAAGRPDDPKQVIVLCKISPSDLKEA